MSERERFEKWWRDSGWADLHDWRERAWEAWQAAIQAERERCAKIAERCECGACECSFKNADAIRRGGEHEHNE